MIPLLAPQPGNPTQFEPQNGAISIANTVTMAMLLARARPTLCVRLFIAILNNLNESTLRQGTRDVNAGCLVTDGDCEKKDPSLPGLDRKGMGPTAF